MKTYIVDSFTDKPFKGNPAGVCLTQTPLSERIMQSIAKELGFSETTFVSPAATAGEHRIRYFSPVMEIPLCGHATLAASKVLFKEHPNQSKIQFRTHSDVKLEIGMKGEQIEMRFPVYKTVPAEAPLKLLDAMGIAEVQNCVFNSETEILMFEIDDIEKLNQLTPNFSEMTAVHSGIHGVLVTAQSTADEYDFHSRFFWPWSGGNEDPVTGGTHTFLAKYWGDKLGKTKMRSFQSSARTGSMDVELVDEDHLLITADAVILLEGNWVGELE